MSAQFVAKAQLLNELKTSFNNYNQNVFQEKIFVHTDKEQYLTGEILWFKVYNVDAVTKKLNDLSKVCYIELLDEKNKPVLQSKIALVAGMGNGSLYIPKALLNGSYTFRAYTNWMKNFETNLFFEKKITILNSLNSLVKSSPKTEIDLQFFPEGGEMIEGIQTNVGFKATNSFGNGVDVRGAVVNQKNDTVARFKSFKFGIGKFSFTPLPNQTYRVVAVVKKEIINEQFPVAKKQGYSLSLNDGERITLDVATNLQANKVYLMVHNNRKINIAETATILEGKASFAINKSKLGDGLSFLTIFNESGQPVCERLYFKRLSSKLKIDANPSFTSYNVRKPVDVNFSIKNEKGDPITANISIAVRRIDSLQGMDQSDILSYLFLSSEVKGNIESPGYYFANETQESNEALDNLLITQGWRRFSWNVVRKNQSPSLQFLPEVNGHLITGKIKSKDGASIKNAALYLSIPKVSNQFYQSTADENGNFVFNTKDINGVNEIVVEAIDTTAIISVLSPFSEKYSHLSSYDITPNEKEFNETQFYSLATQIQNTYSADRLNQFSQLVVDTAMFYGTPFKTYRLNNYTRFRTLEETMREYVTQTFITKGSEYQIRLLGKDVSLNGNPLVLLDGVPYFNMNKVMKIDPYKIERLEIIPEKYYLGSGVYEGILSFFSFKPNLSSIEINANAIVLDYEGIQQQREFYSPAYSSAQEINSRIPDFRNVLYWAPFVGVDKDGKGQVKFYTSNFAGTYIGTINGLSADGTPGVGSFLFQVRDETKQKP